MNGEVAAGRLVKMILARPQAALALLADGSASTVSSRLAWDRRSLARELRDWHHGLLAGRVDRRVHRRLQ